jgi:hypothetical protein
MVDNLFSGDILLRRSSSITIVTVAPTIDVIMNLCRMRTKVVHMGHANVVLEEAQ